MPTEPEPIDVVYTWVDGTFPGYPELLQRHITNEHDRNPNRYRDNIDTLKYSLRSLEKYAPWLGDVHLVTCRPQVPAWLNPSTEGLHVVHHDEIFDAKDLPTFNSFGIVANLHRVPGLGRRFIYMVDDYLFGRPALPSHFETPDGKTKVYAMRSLAEPGSNFGDPGHSRWESALSFSNRLLDARYGEAARGSSHHVPILIDRESWQACADTWKDEFEATRASRFREPANVAAEYLYPYYLVYEGLGTLVSLRETFRTVSYVGLDNIVPLQWLLLRWLNARRTPFYCLNDNFGDHPSSIVERMAVRFLERAYPEPSRFER